MPLSGKTYFLVLVLLYAFIAPIYAEEVFIILNGKKKQNIPIIKAGSLIILKTYINDKGPFNFVLDSGVGLTVITDPSLKDSLNLHYTKKVTISGLGEEESLNAYLTPNIKMNISRIEAKRLGAVILEENIPELSANAGLPIHGLIGFDFFNSFSIKTFYDAGYIICRRKDSHFTPKRGFMIPIALEKRKPYCTAKVKLRRNENHIVKLIIDSGAGHALALESLNDTDFPLPQKIISAHLGMGLGGRINGFLGRIDAFYIDKLEINNLLTSFPAYADVAQKVSKTIPRNGSIGSRLLKYYNVIYDYDKRYIFLEPLHKKFPLLEHNMSGLEITTTGNNYRKYIVERVTPSQLNKDADIKEGDELFAIDFKPVAEMKLEDVYNILRSGDGKNLHIKLRRNNVFINTIITLEKQI